MTGRDRDKSVEFYQLLGFELIADAGFDAGHPLVMLGPATAKAGHNVLMDEAAKYPGITHIAVKVQDAAATRTATFWSWSARVLPRQL